MSSFPVLELVSRFAESYESEAKWQRMDCYSKGASHYEHATFEFFQSASPCGDRGIEPGSSLSAFAPRRMAVDSHRLPDSLLCRPVHAFVAGRCRRHSCAGGAAYGAHGSRRHADGGWHPLPGKASATILAGRDR